MVSSHLLVGYTYRPEGKLDPFAPLSLIRPTLTGTTRLQQHEISDFELVGTLVGKEPTALLMTPDPKEGILVRVGDRIGRHGGRIVSISRDRVLTREPSANSIPGQFTQFTDISIPLIRVKAVDAAKEQKK
jgi:Tfp pilus assembly protein PilP